MNYSWSQYWPREAFVKPFFLFLWPNFSSCLCQKEKPKFLQLLMILSCFFHSHIFYCILELCEKKQTEQEEQIFKLVKLEWAKKLQVSLPKKIFLNTKKACLVHLILQYLDFRFFVKRLNGFIQQMSLEVFCTHFDTLVFSASLIFSLAKPKFTF